MKELHSRPEYKESWTMPRINSKAPDFEANTTHGTLRLRDYEGQWLVLFSHPADFTPVCTTELVSFQKIYHELRRMNTELLGLSIDSVHAHIAWIKNIEENFDVDIEFPVIADLNKDVAMKYGMIMPEESTTETCRAVFIIDDKGKIRSIIYYPLTTGRNMEEIVRTVHALQTTDKHGVATPANWQEGDKVIVPPSTTMKDVKARDKEEGVECVDWYLCKKDL